MVENESRSRVCEELVLTDVEAERWRSLVAAMVADGVDPLTAGKRADAAICDERWRDAAQAASPSKPPPTPKPDDEEPLG